MNMRRIECILLCLFIGILSMAAQTRTVTGSVFDKADNQPVIGATIAGHERTRYRGAWHNNRLGR